MEKRVGTIRDLDAQIILEKIKNNLNKNEKNK